MVTPADPGGFCTFYNTAELGQVSRTVCGLWGDTGAGNLGSRLRPIPRSFSASREKSEAPSSQPGWEDGCLQGLPVGTRSFAVISEGFHP